MYRSKRNAMLYSITSSAIESTFVGDFDAKRLRGLEISPVVLPHIVVRS